MTCPICKKEVEKYYESEHKEPFVHHHPFTGLMIYGPYSADKEVLCQNEAFLHFKFMDGEERLVKLGVENAENAVNDIDPFADDFDYEDSEFENSFDEETDDLPF